MLKCVFPENKDILLYNCHKLSTPTNYTWIHFSNIYYLYSSFLIWPDSPFWSVFLILMKNYHVFFMVVVPLYMPKSSTWEFIMCPLLHQHSLLTLSDNLLEKEWYFIITCISLMGKVEALLLYKELLICISFSWTICYIFCLCFLLEC